MTDIPDSSDVATVKPLRPQVQRATLSSYRLEEFYWGYRVVPVGAPPLYLVILQVIAMLSGAGFLAAAITLMGLASAGDIVLRMPVTFVAFSLGMILMWFASRGTDVNIEIDTVNGEIREVVRNRTGAVSVLARYGFDCIGSVFMVRPNSALPTLTLRYRNSARQLAVATGTEAELARLRDRLGRDLILNRDIS